jgi:hypothetical protein
MGTTNGLLKVAWNLQIALQKPLEEGCTQISRRLYKSLL